MAVSTAGVRDYLKGLGVENSRIGWNERDKYVTLDGQYLLTPESVKDGVSYANPTDIQSAYYRIASNKPGSVITNPYGEKVQSAISTVANTPAYTAPVWDRTYTAPTYTPKYTGKVESLLGETEGASFAYDPETDPSYAAYKQMFERQGKSAMNQAIAATAANTGGVLSSYGAAAANQARQAYAKKAADIIPQLEQQAYSRFADQQNRKLSLASVYQDLENANRSNFESDRNFGYGVYSDDYSRWADQRDFGYGVYSDTFNRNLDLAKLYAQMDSEMFNRDLTERDRLYTQTRDAEDDRRYNQEWAYQLAQDAAKRSSGSSSSKNTVGNMPGTLDQQAYYYRAVNYLQNRFGDDTAAMAQYIAQTASRDDTYRRLMGDELFNYFYSQAQQGKLAKSASEASSSPGMTISEVNTAMKNGYITDRVREAYRYYYGEYPEEQAEDTSEQDAMTIAEAAARQTSPTAWLKKELQDGNITLAQYNAAYDLVKNLKTDTSGTTSGGSGIDW